MAEVNGSTAARPSEPRVLANVAVPTHGRHATAAVALRARHGPNRGWSMCVAGAVESGPRTCLMGPRASAVVAHAQVHIAVLLSDPPLIHETRSIVSVYRPTPEEAPAAKVATGERLGAGFVMFR